MNIAKKLISSLLATTMLISSFVALTAFAEAPTIKGTLLSDEFLFDEEDGIFNAATAGAGVEISFSNFEKNITYLDFELQIPKDLKIEYKVKKNTYDLEDITPTNIKNDALDSPVDFNVYDRSKSDSDFYTIYFQFVNSTATGLSPSEIINIYFASSMEDDAAAYVVKTGSFDIQNVNVGYLGDVDYIKNLSVVQATTAAPTTYTVTCDAVTNGTLSVDKSTAAEGDTVTITATPADNYKLDTLKVVAADGTDVTVTDNKFTMPAQNVTVKATFVEDTPVQPDFEKLGSYTADDSEKDKAVAFVQKLTDMVSSKTYQLYAMVGAKRYNYSKTITLPNITEGAISLGVVIQYNPDEVTADGFNPENVTSFGVTEVE